MYYTYIIKSKKDGSFYVGITENTERRFKEHNCGKSKYTAKKIPWILWHIRQSDNMKNARKEEIYLKKKDRNFKDDLKNVLNAEVAQW